MENNSSDPILIIGIGNPDRGDDGVGIFAIERLRLLNLWGIQLLQHSGEGTSLIDLWQTNRAAIIYIIDAMYSGLPAGSVQYFEVHNHPLPSCFSQQTSTHAFGLAEAVELARSLGCLPQRLLIYGIEGLCFDFGAPLSLVVESASHKVVELLLSELTSQTRMDASILPWRM